MVRKLETHIYLTLELVAIIRNLKFKSTLKSSGRTVALGEGARRGGGVLESYRSYPCRKLRFTTQLSLCIFTSPTQDFDRKRLLAYFPTALM